MPTNELNEQQDDSNSAASETFAVGATNAYTTRSIFSDDADLRNAALRWHVYRILMVISAAVMIARIMAVVSASGNSPFLSANDRSRWCTIRALAHDGTFKIEQVISADESYDPERDPIDEIRRFDPDWNSIDKVVHFGEDGREHYYSSKPTLLTSMLAFEYLLLSGLTDWSLITDTFQIARLMLVVSNVIPMIVMFVLLAFTVERFAKSNWTRFFIMGCATFGTFLTSFAITLNNHLPASVAAMVAIYCLLSIWTENKRHWSYFLFAGLAASFTAANELPALSFLGLVGLICLVKAPKQTLIAFAPAMLIVAAGFFGTNYMAHGTWKPAYAHRSDGDVLVTVEEDLRQELDAGKIPDSLRRALDQAPFEARRVVSGAARVHTGLLAGENGEARWTLFDPENQFRLAIVEASPGKSYEVRQWENWYEYPRSYWIPGRKGPIDQGEPSPIVYTIHMLIGHHGIFSLTPIWLLSLAGIGIGLAKKEWKLQGFAAFVAILFLVVFSFYASRPLEDRNYGGVSSGLRWMFWFTPMLLVIMIPACDSISRKRGWRLAAEIAFGISVFSTLFSPLNPWTHPWLYQWFAAGNS